MSVPANYIEQFKAQQTAKKAAEAEQQALPPLSRKQAKTVRPSADGSRWAMLNAFVDVTLCGLPRSELAVWLVLYRDVRDGNARTGMTDIARRAGCTKRAVVGAIKSLVARGLVRVIRRGRRNQGTSVYTLCGVGDDSPAKPR